MKIKTRDMAAKYARAKLPMINEGLQRARAAITVWGATRLFDRLIADVEELCELEREFPDLLDPHPDVLMAGLQRTKRIRLAMLGLKT